MLKLEETLKFKADSETEAQELINDFRENQKIGYLLKKSSYEYKTKKSKGEIIGECWVVTVVLVHADLWEAAE